jgi:hypothetical protein
VGKFVKRFFGFVLVCAFSTLPEGCSAGRSHTSDASLERAFNQHRVEFEALLADLQVDPQLTSLLAHVVIYAGRRVEIHQDDYEEIERLGLPKVRLIQYEKQLRQLGLVAITRGKEEIEFRVDPGTLFNGDSYKGFSYRLTAPDHLLSSLDGYRISDRDSNPFGGWLVFKPLTGSWYLYLFVNK